MSSQKNKSDTSNIIYISTDIPLCVVLTAICRYTGIHEDDIHGVVAYTRGKENEYIPTSGTYLAMSKENKHIILSKVNVIQDYLQIKEFRDYVLKENNEPHSNQSSSSIHIPLLPESETGVLLKYNLVDSVAAVSRVLIKFVRFGLFDENDYKVVIPQRDRNVSAIDIHRFNVQFKPNVLASSVAQARLLINGIPVHDPTKSNEEVYGILACYWTRTGPRHRSPPTSPKGSNRDSTHHQNGSKGRENRVTDNPNSYVNVLKRPSKIECDKTKVDNDGFTLVRNKKFVNRT